MKGPRPTSHDYYYDYAKNVRSLSEDDLSKAASKFVSPGELTWMVVGDLAFPAPCS